MNKLLLLLIMIAIQSFFPNELNATRRFSQRLASKNYTKRLCNCCDELPSSSKENPDEYNQQYTSESESEAEESDCEKKDNKAKKNLVCPFNGLCKRADSQKPFQTLLTLHMHIVSVHVECPYGESFKSCDRWNEIKKEVIKAFEYEVDLSNMGALQIHKTLKQELRVPLRDHVQECHMGFCRDGRCSYIEACTQCKKIITLARTVMKDHSCADSSENKKKQIKKDDSNSDTPSDCGETDLDYDLTDVELNDCHYDDLDEEPLDWNSETSELSDDSIIRVIHINTDESSTDFSFSDASQKNEFFSCWLQNCDIAPKKFESIKAWRARKHCCAVLSDHAAAVKHLQEKHNICFECMENKAFFPSVEKLIEHENSSHSQEVARTSKSLMYGEKAVCLLCVTEHCQYATPEDLELHKEQKHPRCLSDSEFSDEFNFSCWLENCDIAPKKFESIKAWRARKHCCAELKSQEAVIGHFQIKHKICFECMENKAFFPSLEELIEHENSSHSQEVARTSKSSMYGEKAVCLLCITKHCQYETSEELELHKEQIHQV